MALKDYTSAINVLQTDGASLVVGTPTVTVMHVDELQNVLLAKGTTVPTAGDAGYATGCLFIDTDASSGAQVWVNEGSATSASFNTLGASQGGTSFDIGASTSMRIASTNGITFTQGFGSAAGSAGVFRFASFGNSFGTATGTTFTGTVYNIAIQVPNVGTAYIKATTTV